MYVAGSGVTRLYCDRAILIVPAGDCDVECAGVLFDAVVGDCSAAIHVCLRRLSPRGSTWRSAANFLRSGRPSAISAASASADVCSSGKVIGVRWPLYDVITIAPKKGKRDCFTRKQ